MDDERRRGDRRQRVAGIDLSVHARERVRSTWTCAHPQVRGPPRAKALVMSDAWRAPVETDRSAPVQANVFQERVVVIGGSANGIVLRPQPPGIGADHYERRSSFGIGRCEEETERPTL